METLVDKSPGSEGSVCVPSQFEAGLVIASPPDSVELSLGSRGVGFVDVTERTEVL
jgi:hypothetical protein